MMGSAHSSEVSESPTTRRRLLALGGAGGAAGLATLLAQDQARAGHDGTNVFHLGEENTNPAGTRTVLHHANGEPALDIRGGSGFSSAGDGTPAIHADDDQVGGKTIDVFAEGGTAVYATARPNDGNAGKGVVGVTDNGDGTESGSGIGVEGKTGAGVAILGTTFTTGVGVEARSGEFGGDPRGSLDGAALSVVGRAFFTSGGEAQIPAGQNSVLVEDEFVTSESHITVTLTGDPGSRQLWWIERDPGTGFTVHLTSAPPPHRPETPLTYLIIEPGPRGL